MASSFESDPADGAAFAPSRKKAKTSKGTPRVRRSIEELQDEYTKGNRKPLETLMRAWKGIKELSPTSADSFFVMGGYHGEPFRGAGWGNSSYWGGYCHHGNVLFPTWHRAYLNRLEEALRKVPGCADVSLPFWDETSPASLKSGIPWALTEENFVLDGKTIPNPLRSFVLPKGIVDHLSPFPDTDYSKPKGYETVRYPLSGLVGSQSDQEATKEHNDKYKDYATNVQLLNDNVVAWLTSQIVVNDSPRQTNVQQKFKDCLDAPNYTVFSNTTSASQWYDDAGARVVPLEDPHNSMHLAVGGFDLPNVFDASPIAGANGDMGENDTAGLDPIFYFHHCYVDRVFWLWQKKHRFEDELEIISQYPGTNTVDSQGPTPGFVPNSWLTLDSPLDPFYRADGRPYTSRDVINIETQLGYTYGPGSLDDLAQPSDDVVKTAKSFSLAAAAAPQRNVAVSGINRGAIRGSFLISAFAKIGGERQLVGSQAVLSRWRVAGCANCQTHLEAKAVISLHGLSEAEAPADQVDVEVHTRDGLQAGGPGLVSAGATALAAQRGGFQNFRVQVR